MVEEYSVDDPTHLLQEASDFALYPGTHYPLFYSSFFAFRFLLIIYYIFIIFRCSKRCFSEGLPWPLPSSGHNKVTFIPIQISPHIYLYVFVELKVAIDYFCSVYMSLCIIGGVTLHVSLCLINILTTNFISLGCCLLINSQTYGSF